jgi:hypothetical protein
LLRFAICIDSKADSGQLQEIICLVRIDSRADSGQL